MRIAKPITLPRVRLASRNQATVRSVEAERVVTFADGRGCEESGGRFVASALGITHRIVLFDHRDVFLAVCVDDLSDSPKNDDVGRSSAVAPHRRVRGTTCTPARRHYPDLSAPVAKMEDLLFTGGAAR